MTNIDLLAPDKGPLDEHFCRYAEVIQNNSSLSSLEFTARERVEVWEYFVKLAVFHTLYRTLSCDINMEAVSTIMNAFIDRPAAIKDVLMLWRRAERYLN